MATVKIIYLVTKDDVGGAQKYVQDLAENLDKNEFDVKILTGGKKGVRFLSNAFRPYLLFVNDWLALAELFFEFKREKPDVVHLNSSKAGVIGAMAAKLAGVKKVVFTAHGWVFNPDNELSFLRKKMYILLHKIAALFQDEIINVSEYDRQLATKHKIAGTEKLITIRNGLDCQRINFLDKTTARKALLKIANLSAAHAGNPIWIGSVGRLVVEKSYTDLVEAARLIQNQNVKFFVIGSGPEKQKLQLLITEYQLQDKFFIIENLAPAASYLKAFDIFVLPSIKEGLPYTILEAMAAGLPIIATRVGGISEIVDPLDGNRRGLVMPPREPEELARAINYLLKNPNEANELASNGKKFLKEQLTLDRMILETKLVYNDRKESNSF